MSESAGLIAHSNINDRFLQFCNVYNLGEVKAQFMCTQLIKRPCNDN